MQRKKKKKVALWRVIVGVPMAILGLVVIISVFGEKDSDAQADAPAMIEDASAAPANGPEITLDEFSAIEMDMSYDDVVKIIGADGEISSESSAGDVSMKAYTWEGNGGLGANAVIIFTNDKVMNKTQLGFK